MWINLSNNGACYTRAQIQINANPKWSCQVRDYVYMVDLHSLDSRFTSVLRVVFEDATLTQCDFYRVLKRDAIHVWQLLVYTCNYALIVVFKSTASSYLCSVENFMQIQIDLDLASPPTIRIDLDPHSHVAGTSINWAFPIPSFSVAILLETFALLDIAWGSGGPIFP